jgi:hypothetical protein
VLLLGGFLVSSGSSQPAADDVLAAVESPYQSVRVIEKANGWRALEVNERRGSFQSIWKPEPGLLGPGYYYDAFALPAYWGGVGGKWSALVLGLGSGTAWRVIEGTLPVGVSFHAMGVELDPVVVSLGREFMGLKDSTAQRRTLTGWDARASLGPLSLSQEKWDQIIVDVYANQVEIPAHLATVEFYSSTRELLARGGWLQVNVGASGVDDPLALAIGSSLAVAFEAPTLALEVPFSRNVILVQRLGESPVLPSDERFLPSSVELRELAARMRVPGTWSLIQADDGRVLFDGDAPLEALQRSSLASMSGL